LKPKQKILELENRKNIYEFINKHPGVHQREIIRNIKLSEGTVKYHLNYLIKNGFIDRKKSMGYSRFYPSKKIGTIEKKILDIFRQETPKQILLLLLLQFGMSQSDISMELEKDSKNISRYLNKLIDTGLIEPAVFRDGFMLTNRYETVKAVIKKVGQEKIYRLKQPYLIYYFFVKYKDSFIDDEITNNTIEYITDIGKGVQIKKYDEEKIKERILTAIYDIFPHPYHV